MKNAVPVPGRVKANITLLAVCQALFTSNMSILIALGSLVGYALATDKSLSTLPVATVVVGTAIFTLPAALFMGRLGRRAGFVFGALLAAVGAWFAFYSIRTSDFWLLCFSTALIGGAAAFGQQYRHAAVEMAPESFRGWAVSLVMAGGVVAGFLGPYLATETADLFPPYTYAGSYAACIVLALIAAVILMFLRIPSGPARIKGATSGRPIGEIVRQPVFLVAAAAGMAGFGSMSLIMTATPLAMKHCGFVFDQSALVISMHVVAMYAPSFVTGYLIQRFGVLNVIIVGAISNFVCVVVALSGIELINFQLALVLLGIGWNFMFVGGTTLLAEAHTPEEGPKVQGVNDFMVFGVVAASSLGSGQLLDQLSWNAVTLAAIPMLAVAASGAIWLSLRNRMKTIG